MLSTLVLSVDPSLGRIEKSTLPQQTLMELLIGNITYNKRKICGSVDSPYEFTQWDGVRTESNQIVDISWEHMELEGSVNFEWIPSTVTVFSVYANRLSQEIDLAKFPSGIYELDLSCNEFDGGILLKDVPEDMVDFNLDHNSLAGTLDLDKFPHKVAYVTLNNNLFSGTVCLTHLPESMRELDIRDNRLSGTIDLTQLPMEMRELAVSHNLFEGETDFSHLPDTLRVLNVSHTQLSGDFSENEGRVVHWEHSGVKLMRNE